MNTTGDTQPADRRVDQPHFEVAVDVKAAARFLGGESVLGVCLRGAKADSPFPNDGPRNSVQPFRTRKVAAKILRRWRNR